MGGLLTIRTTCNLLKVFKLKDSGKIYHPGCISDRKIYDILYYIILYYIILYYIILYYIILA